jgi:hypothetical protein
LPSQELKLKLELKEIKKIAQEKESATVTQFIQSKHFFTVFCKIASLNKKDSIAN